jgi:esterase/lipase superfamily enzyme
MTNVYFATNRSTTPEGGFGSGIVAPADTCYAVTEVANIDLDQENSGDLAAITMRQAGGFADTVQAEILAAGKNLLVFIHGFDNSFEDAIKRSAFNREWFAAAQRPATDTTVLAFTWPSEGRLFPNHPAILDGAYKTDQSMSGASGPHIAAFLRLALDLGRRLKQQHAGARVFLLAHSMGNHALQAAVEQFFAAGPPPALFDEVILAAADEEATTLERPDHAGLFRLRDLAGRISVYYSHRDVAMAASLVANDNVRLGFDAMPHKSDAVLYPLTQFRWVDCTAVFDLAGGDSVPLDASHQYYRRSKTVRADIALVMANDPMVRMGGSALSTLPFPLG